MLQLLSTMIRAVSPPCAGLNELRVTDITEGLWEHEINSLNFEKHFSAMEHLFLEFNEPVIWEETANVANLIATSSQLRSLRIAFASPAVNLIEEIYKPLSSHFLALVDTLPNIINMNQRCDHLLSLSLGSIVTAEHDLRTLLTGHSSTLHSLELSHIKFREALTIGPGSWI
jgi:hypothetical protein